ncbi:insulin-like growth factor-binding protein 2 [Scomber japonicus]|uniref:insulin-like growth factor-binding protein 2 n=1 Tax=Scomber japonicus TaxID=13676 RepID=UPI0023050F70|nr:insulin-like growth factor-binding protein 2 [Scomber japonicus]
MSDPETPNQPLLNHPAPETGGRPSRAYKVAGLTLFACALIAGQAMIAYFLLAQRGDIRSLKEQNNNMKAELSKGRSVAVPMQMHVPMKALPELMIDSVDEESSTAAPMKGTDCQMEAAGIKPVQVPGFRPACDPRGLYQAQQCFMEHCWCVNPVTGEEVPRSLTRGPARCSRAASFAGGLSNMLTLSDADV